jgi:TolB-like protein/lipoprotein NlpI
MFTDIVGYTALMGSDEEKAFKVLRKNREIHRHIIKKYHGEWLKEMGDGILASFQTSSYAVRCAGEIQHATNKEGIGLRIGIHEGEVVFEGGDVLGDGVNVASRLEEIADEGSINISEAVYRDIKNKAGITAGFIAEKKLKNVEEPVKVYRASCDIRIEEERIKVKEQKSKKPKSIIYILAGSGVIIVAFLIWQYIQVLTPRSTYNKEKSVAVLPFDNESADEENLYFVNGMMEDIRNNLSTIADLRVISKTSTEKYRETLLTSKEIASELKVNYLLEGTVQKQGDQVKIHAQLIDAETDDHIWSESYRREIRNIFDVQSEIAQEIAEQLRAVITPEEMAILETKPTTNLTAYDFYLRAREEHTKFWLDNANIKALRNAISLYKAALSNDSTFSEAYSGLARAYRGIYITDLYTTKIFSEFERDLYRDSILSLIDKALFFNPRSEEAYNVKGWYYAGIQEYDSAILNFNLALEINPNYSPAYDGLSRILFENKNEIIDGIRYKLKAIELERGSILPDLLKELGVYYEHIGFYNNAIEVYNQIFQLTADTLTFYFQMGGAAYVRQDYKERIRWQRKMLEFDPDNFIACVFLTDNYFLIGEVDSAQYYADRMIELRETVGMAVGWEMIYGYVLWQKGDKKEAMQNFDIQNRFSNQLIESDNGGDFQFLQLAQIYAITGQKEKAIEYLYKIDYKTFKQRWFIVRMDESPFFKEIKSDQRYQDILNTMKLVWQEEHEKVRAWLEEEEMLL